MRPPLPNRLRGRRAVLSLAALVLTTATACGSDPESGSDSTGESPPTSSEAGEGSVEGLTVTGDFGKKPTVEIDGLDVDKAQSAVVIEGDGAEVTDATSVKYRYLLANGTTGKALQDNYAVNELPSLAVGGQPAQIKDAILGRHIGDRVALAVPVTDLLGEQGNPQMGLKPSQDIVFVFDLVEEAEAPLTAPEGTAVEPPADAPKVVTEGDAVTGIDFSAAPEKAPTKLQVIPLIEGDGVEVKEGDNLTVNYFGAVWGKGETPFDESYSREPAAFQLSKGSLIDGWVQGLAGVKAGSRVMLVIPPELGYGAQGSGEDIPPDSSLVFVIDVLGVNL